MSSAVSQRRLTALAGAQRPLVEEQFISVRAASVYLGMPDERFVRRLVAERRIAYCKFGTHVRIAVSVLEEYMRASVVPAAPVRRRMRRAA